MKQQKNNTVFKVLLFVLIILMIILGIVVYNKYFKDADAKADKKIYDIKKDIYNDISDNFKLNIKSTYYQDNEYSFYTIEGRIQNISNTSYDKLNIVYQCYDSNDNELALAFGEAENVKAGETNDFYAIAIQTDGIDHCKLKYINEDKD